jgi:hypothetical protein
MILFSTSVSTRPSSNKAIIFLCRSEQTPVTSRACELQMQMPLALPRSILLQSQGLRTLAQLLPHRLEQRSALEGGHSASLQSSDSR